MTVVTLPYQSGDFIFKLANWLCENGHGPQGRDDQKAALIGSGWKLYHTTINYNIVTKAEFDNDDVAAMFALRWR